MAVNKIDSNVTGLRYAVESELKVVPGGAVWKPLEPNSYKDFGGQISTVTRNPINASRQRKKGTVTDLDASGGFQQDLTQTNATELLQGFMFANIRQHPSTAPRNAPASVDIGAVDGVAHTYAAPAGLDIFLVNHLVLGSGFGVAGNNGVHKVSVVAGGLLTVSAGLATEANAPATAKLEAVGYEFTVATLDVTIVGGMPRLNRAAGAVDFTTLGLIPGEWIFVGGDSPGSRFVNNAGFARVKAVAAGYIDLDKVDWTPQAEVGAGLTVQIYFGEVLKNESDPALIERRSYQLERTLGEDDDGVMSEYLVGAVPNELTVNIKQADKVTLDMDFVGLDVEQRTGATGVKAGTRPNLVESEAFNTSSDFTRIKMSLVKSDDAHPEPLFAFLTELSFSVKNNVSPNKAVGTLGAFDVSAGMFEVSGKVTAYFADITAVQAVRNNSDVTIDAALVKDNAGFVFDVPLIGLGNGRLTVEQDKAIELPLDMNAVEGSAGHTFLINVFQYLPTLAAGTD